MSNCEIIINNFGYLFIYISGIFDMKFVCLPYLTCYV